MRWRFYVVAHLTCIPRKPEKKNCLVGSQDTRGVPVVSEVGRFTRPACTMGNSRFEVTK